MGNIEHYSPPEAAELDPHSCVTLRRSPEQYNEKVIFDVMNGEQSAGLVILQVNEAEPSVRIDYFEVKQQFRGRGHAKRLFQGVIDGIISGYPESIAIESVPTETPAMAKIRNAIQLPEGWQMYYDLDPREDLRDYFEGKTLMQADMNGIAEPIPFQTNDLSLVIECISRRGKAVQVIEKTLTA